MWQNIHVHIYLSICIYFSVSLVALGYYLLRESPLCKARGYSVNMGHVDAVRNQSHLMGMWVIVPQTTQATSI